MDYKREYYYKTKKVFLNSIQADCKEKEDYDICVKKNLKAFDIVFEALKAELENEKTLIKTYKEWEQQARDVNFPDPQKL